VPDAKANDGASAVTWFGAWLGTELTCLKVDAPSVFLTFSGTPNEK